MDYYVVPDPTKPFGYMLGKSIIESLGPGAASAPKRRVIYFPPESVIPPGNYYVAFTVDAGNQVAESDEANAYYLKFPFLTVADIGTGVTGTTTSTSTTTTTTTTISTNTSTVSSTTTSTTLPGLQEPRRRRP